MVAAGAGDDFIGWTEEAAAQGNAVAVTLRNDVGEMTLANAVDFAVGDTVYTDDAGQHGKTNTNTKVGIAVSTSVAGVGVKTIMA